MSGLQQAKDYKMTVRPEMLRLERSISAGQLRLGGLETQKDKADMCRGC